MFQKIIFTFLVVILIVGCQAAPAPTSTPVPPTETSVSPAPTAALTLQPTQVVIPVIETRQETGDSSDPVYTYQVNYPWIDETLFPQYAAFNQGIQQVVTDSITQFLKDTEQFKGVKPPSSGSLLQGGSAIVYNDNGILSVYLGFQYYIQGAAHPFNITITRTYQASNGQFLELSQLFTSGALYLDTISAYCVNDLTQRGLLETPGGASPKESNYERWNISPDGLLITFDEYSIGPYAMGIQTVTVPYSALAEIINPNGVLSGFLAGQ